MCAFIENNFVNQISFHPQLSERMKVVDVISSKAFSDSQQIIAQVMNLFCSMIDLFIFFGCDGAFINTDIFVLCIAG